MDDDQVKAFQAAVHPDYDGRVLEPKGDWIYCRRLHRENLSPSGLYVGGLSADEQYEFVAIACGPGYVNEQGIREPMDVKPGETFVADGATGGFALDGRRQFAITNRQVVGVLRGAVPERMVENRGRQPDEKRAEEQALKRSRLS